ncbi:MAG: FtsX-like permease family protein [Myxococcota bacterium]
MSIGLRYLRSKKSSMVSVISVVAVAAVAVGVSALLAVLSITSGFQEAFRTKVLGVNAHVLVLKYGLDFDEYRDVIQSALEMPEVAGAAPFVINEMMLARGDRLSGVLVKGVDPEAMPTVLDLPEHMTEGSLDGLRLASASPPLHPDDLSAPGVDEDLDEFLSALRQETEGMDDRSPDNVEPGQASIEGSMGPDDGMPSGNGMGPGDSDDLNEAEMEALRNAIAASGGQEPILTEEDLPPGSDGGDPLADLNDGPPEPGTLEDGALEEGTLEEGTLEQGPLDYEPLPEVDVPSLEEAEAALRELEGQELPTDEEEGQIFDDEEGETPAIPVEDLPGIVVGATLAQNLGLSINDRVQVISPLAGLDTSLWGANNRTPRSREFRVIGVFEAGFQEYDSRLVYVDLYEAQRFFEQGDTVTGVEIRLHDLEKAPIIAERIERELGAGPFHTMDWEQLNHNLFTALEIQKVALSLAIATIIIVAAFCVIAVLIMIVLDKKREIAILKAMGTTDFEVLIIFSIQGVLIGVIGTLVGLLLGGGVVAYLSAYEFALDPKVYLIDHLPVRTNKWDFIITCGVALLICSCATLFPSWSAARMLPTEGVKDE